jgi:hypothetical protein
MNAVLNQLGATLGWLFALAPLLLVGLLMAADPCGFRSLCGSLCRDLAAGVRRFEDQLHNGWPRSGPQSLSRLDTATPSQTTDAVVRFAGLATAAVSLLGLWEVLR